MSGTENVLIAWPTTFAADGWESWRHGWLDASWFNETRGDERGRWLREAA